MDQILGHFLVTVTLWRRTIR